MRYCINYTSKFQRFDQVDEVNIRATESLKLIKSLMKDYDCVVNLKIYDIQKFLQENMLEKLTNDELCGIKFLLGDYKNVPQEIKDSGIPYFFTTPATDWEILRGLAELNPCRIYVCEGLGFDLNNVSRFLKEKNIELCIFPNIAQSSWSTTSDLKKFFVRPSDVSFLEGIADVLELYAPESIINTVFKIYAIKENWQGDLSILIDGLDQPIDSATLHPAFMPYRLGCKRKCLGGDGKCNICERLGGLSKIMTKKQIGFVTDEDSTL